MKISLCQLLLSAGVLLLPWLAAAQCTIVASDDFNRSDESPFAIGGNWGRVVAGNYDGVPTAAHVRVSVIDVQGRRVAGSPS